MIKKAIILYFILLCLMVFYKPNMFKNNHIDLPCIVIILSIVSYFIIDFIYELFFKNKK